MKRVFVFVVLVLLLVTTACASSAQVAREQMTGAWTDERGSCMLNLAQEDSYLFQALSGGNIQIDYFDYDVEDGALVLKFRSGKTVRLPISVIQENQIELTWEDGSTSIFNRNQDE